MSAPNETLPDRLGQLQGQVVWSFRLAGVDAPRGKMGRLSPAMQLLHIAAPHAENAVGAPSVDAALFGDERKMALAVQAALEAGVWSAFDKLEPAQRAYLEQQITLTKQHELDHEREAKAAQVRYDAHTQEQARLKQEAFDRAHAPCPKLLASGPRKGSACGKLYKVGPLFKTCTQHHAFS